MGTSRGSISFDHAADTYDATRAWPDHVQRAQTEALLAEIDGRRVLEIGVGTGRIARPLAERGVRVTGVDIAPRMLARLREQLEARHTPPDLLLGDATRLPFADASFGAAYAVHVLHLVSDWQGTLEELRRVLAPGGVLVHHTVDFQGDNPWAAGMEKWQEMLAARRFTRRHRPEDKELHEKLRALGAAMRKVAYAEDEERTTPAQVLDVTARRVNSWTWEIPDDVFADCIREYEAWLPAHHGSMERMYVQHAIYEMEVWTFP
jgi:ubiquinone/menaquinone biosynthesis C-methylase UbiE